MRTTVKADLGCSSAECIYGTTLALPGELIVHKENDNLDPMIYVDRLKQYMSQMLNALTRPANRPSFQQNDLQTCTHVRIRTDTVKGPLVPPCRGPFKILKIKRKVFILDIYGKKDTVNIDRLKQAYMDTEISPKVLSQEQTFQATTPTPQSGISHIQAAKTCRRVKFPKHLVDYV